ncbi:MAG: IS200/IS605 family transposase [Anaerolineae bacterium]|nr:IS200/IS605 family transposase [Anaerolineae bacterium]
MSFWRLHYHLIWATHQREPLLVDEVERQVYGTILNKAKELSCLVHAIGGVDNHLHLAVSIPPKLAVAEAIRQLKGASAYYVNHRPHPKSSFSWQKGYGALTFGERSMEIIVAYVHNQKEHHHQGTTIALYEHMEADE